MPQMEMNVFVAELGDLSNGALQNLRMGVQRRVDQLLEHCYTLLIVETSYDIVNYVVALRTTCGCAHKPEFIVLNVSVSNFDGLKFKIVWQCFLQCMTFVIRILYVYAGVHI